MYVLAMLHIKSFTLTGAAPSRVVCVVYMKTCRQANGFHPFSQGLAAAQHDFQV